MAKIGELTVGQKLRRLREAAGLSQEELAVAVGVTRQTLYAYEIDRTSPRLAELLRVTSVLGMPLDIFGADADLTPFHLEQAEIAGMQWRADALARALAARQATVSTAKVGSLSSQTEGANESENDDGQRLIEKKPMVMPRRELAARV